MSHAQALYAWEERLATRFAELPAHERSWLAWVSGGIVLAQAALLSQVVMALAVAFDLGYNTVRQRLRRLYQPRPRPDRPLTFDYTACFGPLLRWVTAGFPQHRLLLALDPTNLGDRFTILTASVVFRGSAVPVAWNVRGADEKGSWNTQWQRLLDLLHAALGAGWQVVVLGDRGLQSKDLFDAIVALGWHPLLRVKKAGHFRPKGWTQGWALGRFAPHVGTAWKGVGVAWPTSSRLSCTLLACWEEGHAEPWLLVTDLAPAAATAAWYGWRTWIEGGFRDLKSDGWQVSKTRMTDPERVARWWTAVALATVWTLEAGQTAQHLELPALRTLVGVDQPLVLSLFAVGRAWLAAQITRGHVRRLRQLRQPPWPTETHTCNRLSEKKWLAEHNDVPL